MNFSERSHSRWNFFFTKRRQNAVWPKKKCAVKAVFTQIKSMKQLNEENIPLEKFVELLKNENKRLK